MRANQVDPDFLEDEWDSEDESVVSPHPQGANGAARRAGASSPSVAASASPADALKPQHDAGVAMDDNFVDEDWDSD